MKTKILAFLSVIVFLSACASQPRRYHVMCYSGTGEKTIDVNVERAPEGDMFRVWVDSETGEEVILPANGCIWRERR